MALFAYRRYEISENATCDGKCVPVVVLVTVSIKEEENRVPGRAFDGERRWNYICVCVCVCVSNEEVLLFCTSEKSSAAPRDDD